MFYKIIAAIVAFVVWLFPSLQRIQPLDNTAIANSVISAMKTRDVTALEALMCKNIKDNTSDLPGEIGKLLDAMDGEKTEFTWLRAGGCTVTDGKGHTINQNYLLIDITTSSEKYGFLIILETYNNLSPAEMGIRSIALILKADPVNDLYRIQATNGLYEWHE